MTTINVFINGINCKSSAEFTKSMGFLRFKEIVNSVEHHWNPFIPSTAELFQRPPRQTTTQSTNAYSSAAFDPAIASAWLGAAAASHGATSSSRGTNALFANMFEAVRSEAETNALQTAQTIITTLEEKQPKNLRLNLFGHSHGGLVVREILNLRPEIVDHSFVFGCPWHVPQATRQYHCKHDPFSLCFEHNTSQMQNLRVVDGPDSVDAHSLLNYANAFATDPWVIAESSA